MSNENQEITIDDFDLGSLEKILLKTKNDEAIDEVEAEIRKIDSMADRLSTHASKLLDIMEEDDNDSKPKRLNSKPTRKPSSVYVSSQIANMISMKTLKLALLKHKNDLGTSSLDRAMKILTSINKDDSLGKRDLPLDRVLALLLSKNVAIPSNSRLMDALQHTDTAVDEELDRMIMEHDIPSIVYTEVNEGIKEPTEDTNIEFNTESDNILFLDTSEDKIYIVDSEYNVLSEVSEDNVDIVELEDGRFYCNINNLYAESDEEEDIE